MHRAFVENDTRLRGLTIDDQTRLDSITIRAENIISGDEERDFNRAFADILSLLVIVGGEYATRARELQ